MPTTVSELARIWAVSHQYVSRLAKRGMPLESVVVATMWRETHASSKASTNPIRIARAMDEENGRESAIDHDPLKHPLENKLGDTEPSSERTLETAVMNAHRAADEAWRLLHEAMIEGKASKIHVLLSIHNKAVEALFTAESAYREELERRRILIPLAEAMDIARRGFDVILQRLKALPQNVASLCNPADPARAITALESECTAILSDGQKVYASWSDDRAPASNSSQL